VTYDPEEHLDVDEHFNSPRARSNVKAYRLLQDTRLQRI